MNRAKPVYGAKSCHRATRRGQALQVKNERLVARFVWPPREREQPAGCCPLSEARAAHWERIRSILLAADIELRWRRNL